MESSLFYNTFFAVAKKQVPLLEAVKSLPDDVVCFIGNFLNAKEIVAKERLQRLTIAKEKYMARTTYDWLVKWNEGRQHFLPRIVKNNNKTIKYKWDNQNGPIKILKKTDIVEFCKKEARELDSLISVCAYRSRPKPLFFGQEYTDIAGNRLWAVWVRHTGDDFYYGQTVIYYTQPMSYDEVQGCVRMQLHWKRIN
jgi:hypothetical protein